MSLKAATQLITNGTSFDDLKAEVKEGVVAELLDPEIDEETKAAYLVSVKGKETGGMVTVFAEALVKKGIDCSGVPCCDIVGTGGDGKNTFNISTPASIIASCVVTSPLTVAKHGNRSASAASGSADVIEHLGASLLLSPDQAREILTGNQYCFIFAPAFHPELRHVAALRKNVGFKTVFNLLGPLLNPTSPSYSVVGVGQKEFVEVIVEALKKKSSMKKCLVVHSTDGMDKISPVVPTETWLVSPGEGTVEYKLLKPEDFGINPEADKGNDDYFSGGGSPTENAATIIDILEGKASPSLQNFVYVQAAALSLISGCSSSLKEAMDHVKQAVSSNLPRTRLDNYVRSSTQITKDKSTDILTRILKRRAVDLVTLKRRKSMKEMEEELSKCSGKPNSIVESLKSAAKTGICAELKRASPSEGDINATCDLVEKARKYSTAGVNVISVLTEPVWFKGTIKDLSQIRETVDSTTPRPTILRKDFIFDKYQILESRLAGADSLLLIVSALPTMEDHGESLESLINYSRSLGMEPLVEVVTEEEVDIAVKAGAVAIGINNRDLRTFKVDLTRTGTLISYASKHHETEFNKLHWVALSGISTHEHVKAVTDHGAQSILVGTSLMRSNEPDEMIKQWREV
eukprot:TRINITY_DN7531_c7_g1_i1.p1 TRINITY_DN7531_c7_g1~~TRINITY_DN7531_c7_g1_i1.p1  ORF type:complete len:633 (+),score=139.50 TRINITY_DN7531_c7_g1_i1:45-1943(+)